MVDDSCFEKVDAEFGGYFEELGYKQCSFFAGREKDSSNILYRKDSESLKSGRIYAISIPYKGTLISRLKMAYKGGLRCVKEHLTAPRYEEVEKAK